MDENLPGGLKFNLDSVLSRLEPGPTFPPLLLVTGQYYLTRPLCMVCGMIRMISRLEMCTSHVGPGILIKLKKIQVSSYPSNYMLIAKIIMAEAESQK